MSELPNRQSFLGELLTKMADVKKAGAEAGINTQALVKEVKRQMGQVSTQKSGDPITGKGVTKSGEED
ncbi:MAG: hypothetical protein NZM02_02450 [Patescibacteria group bacterium]|nr:hypothetical protein [Patescibacteria group bacterium]